VGEQAPVKRLPIKVRPRPDGSYLLTDGHDGSAVISEEDFWALAPFKDNLRSATLTSVDQVLDLIDGFVDALMIRCGAQPAPTTPAARSAPRSTPAPAPITKPVVPERTRPPRPLPPPPDPAPLGNAAARLAARRRGEEA
jgi:hypothetical protein